MKTILHSTVILLQSRTIFVRSFMSNSLRCQQRGGADKFQFCLRCIFQQNYLNFPRNVLWMIFQEFSQVFKDFLKYIFPKIWNENWFVYSILMFCLNILCDVICERFVMNWTILAEEFLVRRPRITKIRPLLSPNYFLHVNFLRLLYFLRAINKAKTICRSKIRTLNAKMFNYRSKNHSIYFTHIRYPKFQ